MAPRPEQAQIELLCNRPETQKRAQDILTLAKAKTGRGTSYNIEKSRAGLPAVCALLASQELQNDDVSQDVAQKSSFLNPRAFANTLALVRAALRGDEEVEDTPRTARRASKAFEETKSHVAKFEDLARKYTVSGNTVVGMREARDELVKSDSPRAKRLLQPQCANLLTCVVFAWACKVVHFKSADCTPIKLREAWNLDLADWKQAEKIVNEECRKARDNLASAASSVLSTPSSVARQSSKKQSDMLASLLKGNSSKDKDIGPDDSECEPSQSPSKSLAAAPQAPLPTPLTARGVRYVGKPPPKFVHTDTVTVVHDTVIVRRASETAQSPSKRKAEEDVNMSGDDASPRKRPFIPTTPSKLRTEVASKDCNPDEETEEEGEEEKLGPSKLDFNKTEDREMAQTPTKRRYVGQHPSIFLPSPSASPLKSLTPTKGRVVDPAPASPTKTAAKTSLPTPTKTPTKKQLDTPTKPKTKAMPRTASKPTRRLTRSAARNSFGGGFYYEDSGSELDSDEAADPSRNLFTQTVRSPHSSDTEDSEEDVRAARHTRALSTRRDTGSAAARLLMRGGAQDRVSAVFRDRQALYAVDPLLAAKVRMWKKAQTKGADAEGAVSPMHKAGKRKARS